jgi:hypothetical protein
MRVSATGCDLERLNTERNALLVHKQGATDLNRPPRIPRSGSSPSTQA